MLGDLVYVSNTAIYERAELGPALATELVPPQHLAPVAEPNAPPGPACCLSENGIEPFEDGE